MKRAKKRLSNRTYPWYSNSLVWGARTVWLRWSLSNIGNAAVQNNNALASTACKALEPSVRADIADAFEMKQNI